MIAIEWFINSAKICVAFVDAISASSARCGMSAVLHLTAMFQRPAVVQCIAVISVANHLEQNSLIAVIVDAFAMYIVVEFAIGV